MPPEHRACEPDQLWLWRCAQQPMAYQLFDRDNRPISQADLQNRAAWYEHGLSAEQVFVSRYGSRLNVAVNPAKQRDPTAPDLVFRGHLADLKCQNTPFFLAHRYGLQPTYAVTFNLKDALSYGPAGHDYRGFHVIYWVDWVAVRMRIGDSDYGVRPLTGVWAVEFARLDALRRQRPIHWYNQRERHEEADPHRKRLLAGFEPRLVEGERVWAIRGRHDNAACSYLFDLNDFERLD